MGSHGLSILVVKSAGFRWTFWAPCGRLPPAAGAVVVAAAAAAGPSFEPHPVAATATAARAAAPAMMRILRTGSNLAMRRSSGEWTGTEGPQYGRDIERTLRRFA